MTWIDKTGLISHDRKFNFLTQTEYKLLKFSVSDSSAGWPSGDPCKHSGVFMVPWTGSSELCVPIKSCGAG